MYEFLLINHHEQIFEIALNRTDKRNALSLPLLQELDRAFDEAEKAYTDGQARALIIRAEGRAFSSGIDLEGMDDYIETFGEAWRKNLFATTALLQNIFTKLERHSLPTICVMHGYCLGSAFELALACDFRIAAERTRMGLPEARLGIVPDVGGTVRLIKLVGPSRAKEIIMTGRNIEASDAYALGMLNYVVPKAEIMNKANELAEELILSAPLAVNYAKRVVNDIMDNQRGLNIEAWAQAALFRTEDFEAGVRAMLTKEYPVDWQGK